MANSGVVVNVMADLVVAGLTVSVLVALGALVWLTLLLTIRAATRVRPSRRPSSAKTPAPSDPRD